MTTEFIGLSAFLMGLLGSGHCAGMCGGISGAYSLQIHHKTLLNSALVLITYNFGRASSYAVAGAAAGTIGFLIGDLIDIHAWSKVLRVTAGAFILVIGLCLVFRLKLPLVNKHIGQPLWQKVISPLIKYFSSEKNLKNTYIAGLLWGWLPCGLVYSALLLALSSGSTLNGAIVMLCFALGTLPALLLSGVTLARLGSLISRNHMHRAVGVTFLIIGLWTSLVPLQMTHDHHHHHHAAMEKH